MIEQDSGARKQPKAFPIHPDHTVRELFCEPIWISGLKDSVFSLRRGRGISEQLTTRGLKHSYRRVNGSRRLKQPDDRHAVDLSRRHRIGEQVGAGGSGRKIVNLLWSVLLQDLHHRSLVTYIGANDDHSSIARVGTETLRGSVSPRDPNDPVTLPQQHFREKRAILTSDSRNDRGLFHQIPSYSA
jgi:hypothetical protein